MRRREFIAGVLLGATTQAHAQQRVYRIALIHPSRPIADMSETGSHPFFRVLFAELRRLGFVEGENLTAERYSAEGQRERYAEIAREVVRSKPDVVFAVTGHLLAHFRGVAIPITGITNDPIGMGLVTSLARPGGNITGVVADAGFGLDSKRLELLKQAAPTASRVALLAPRAEWDGPASRALRDAAQQAGVPLLGALLGAPIQEAEYRRVFAAMTHERPDAVFVSDAAEHFTYRHLIVELAEQARLPAIYPDRMFAEAGGLVSYGPDFLDLYRHAAGQIAGILKGAKPSEIAFYQTTKFKLILNLRTAKALGLDLPPTLLAHADEVIE